MWMVKNPEYYDVIVTTNMFGDIITDLGGMLQGGMGVAAGGNINPDPGGTSMFEPNGWQCPQIHRAGRDQSDRRHQRDGHAARSGRPQPIRRSYRCSRSPRHGRKDAEPVGGKMGYSTSEVGDLVVAELGVIEPQVAHRSIKKSPDGNAVRGLCSFYADPNALFTKATGVNWASPSIGSAQRSPVLTQETYRC